MWYYLVHDCDLCLDAGNVASGGEVLCVLFCVRFVGAVVLLLEHIVVGCQYFRAYSVVFALCKAVLPCAASSPTAAFILEVFTVEGGYIEGRASSVAATMYGLILRMHCEMEHLGCCWISTSGKTSWS